MYIHVLVHILIIFFGGGRRNEGKNPVQLKLLPSFAYVLQNQLLLKVGNTKRQVVNSKNRSLSRRCFGTQSEGGENTGCRSRTDSKLKYVISATGGSSVSLEHCKGLIQIRGKVGMEKNPATIAITVNILRPKPYIYIQSIHKINHLLCTSTGALHLQSNHVLKPSLH